MAGKLALMVAIGGAVNSSVGAAFNTVEGRIKKLEDKGNKAKVLKSTIGETIRLRDEWKKAYESGSAGAAELSRKLESNYEILRKQGVQVGHLRKEYQQLQRVAKGTDLQMKGHQQIEQGKAGLKTNMGQAVVGAGALGVAGKISADYQAIIRDIAIKADVVNQPQEAQLSRTVIQTSQETGMARNDVADLVNQLVGAGMDLSQAMSYAPVAAKFAIGQGSSGVDTASMIQALQQNAKITDPKVMEQALEAIALQGQAGSFEASDMAKWFPQLLAGMEKNGSIGMESVSSLGAMLQVQMKTAGGSDEAANNLKNWMEKIGSGDVVKAYKDAGIDYQKSLNTGIQKGMSTLESSFSLAMEYIQATDPAKAAAMAEAQAKISKEADPEKAKAMLNALEQSLRTGDIFADMQVKAALTAYAGNRDLYEQLKKDSQNAKGILDKNLRERREASAQKWAEATQAINDSMRSLGEAIAPVTDLIAVGITKVAHVLTNLSDGSQSVVLGITAIGAGFVAFKAILNSLKIARGLANVGRGLMMERSGARLMGGAASAAAGGGMKTGIKPVDSGLKLLGGLMGASNDPNGGNSREPQRVFVVNAGALGGPGIGGGGPAEGRGRGRRRQRQGSKSSDRPSKANSRPVSSRPDVPKPLVSKPAGVSLPSAAPGKFGNMLSMAGKATKFSKGMPGGAVLDAGVMAIDTMINAKTQDEKAEGYGGAAGGLAGTMAGMAAGAAIGSVVPVIGTAIGGAVGAFLGGMGGESLGAMLGKSWFGSDEKDDEKETAVAKADDPSKADKPAVPGDAVRPLVENKPPAKAGGLVTAAAPAKPAAGAVPGEVVRSTAVATPTAAVPALALAKAPEVAKPGAPKVDQNLTLTLSVPVTVQGDVKDPAQFARELAPHLRQPFEEFARQVAARQLSDAPHV
ncbi:phage tail tape measure protein [Pseudomonas sp. 2(2015)]|uniref:phage tail tape measure protein n=1 Tax=Pseudomonas sp. 2(2015) TaxID=1619950 RepID=UPI0005EBA9C6|nr:phage tail tape measure protein [Pseudomonas sp. 2(2015)]KJK17170.1 tail protein [Pseudomonas sp. 2(2015)]